MERYAAVLLYAIPFFITLILIEKFFDWKKNASVIHDMDTLASLSSGVTNVIKDVLGLSLVIISYGWIQRRIGIFNIQDQWYVYVIAFIGIDFAGYWNHRLNHHVNYFWNVHLIHHSSEEFNLACALRQSISKFFGTFVFFLIPTALIGVPGSIITVVAPLHLFAQYWYHTRLIGKMGFLEKILVTPSHHRVHHAINKEYLDKNLSQIFIFWDKLFGTFQEELDDVPAVFGVKRAPRTWNPFLINFSHLGLLVQDAWRTRSWWDKLRIWFMPTGWRPSDMQEKYPVAVIEDVYTYEKYRPVLSKQLRRWCWFQAVVTILLMFHMFIEFKTIGFPSLFFLGGFIYISVFNYTSQMDNASYALLTALIHSLAGLSIIFITKDWFSMSQYGMWPVYGLSVYFIFSLAISWLLIKQGRSSLHHANLGK